MRWIFLLLTVVCTFILFQTENTGLMGLSLLGAVVFSFAAVLGFAQARIESNAQSQSTLLTSRDVQSIRQQSVLKKVAQNRKANPQQHPGRTPAGSD